MADVFGPNGLSGTGIYAYMTGEVPVWDAALNRFAPGSASGSGITELTGDVTAGPGSGAQVATLAATAVTPGTYGDATNVAQITVDTKGRVTSAVDVPISTGTGDVVGPASAVDDRIATFDGVTGKLIQDGGETIAGAIATAIGASGDVDGPAASIDKEIALFDGTTGKLLERATGTGIVRVASGVYGTPGAVDLTSEVTGDLPFANLTPASAASRLLGRGSASGAGDYQEVTLGTGVLLTGTVLSASGTGTNFGFTAPVDANFAWINQGSAAVTSAAVWGGTSIFLIGSAAAGPSVHIRKEAAPATPYTITALFVPRLYNINFQGLGLVFRQSSDGKLVLYALDETLTLSVSKWTDATTFSLPYASVNSAWRFYGPFLGFQISDDGANRICRVSMDGVYWATVHSIGRTDFLTADEVGFAVKDQNVNATPAMTLLSWAAT